MKTEDGVNFKTGDKVFNYYDMEIGTVGEIEEDGWFNFIHDDGLRDSYLNGERICTIQFAQTKGWL